MRTRRPRWGVAPSWDRAPSELGGRGSDADRGREREPGEEVTRFWAEGCAATRIERVRSLKWRWNVSKRGKNNWTKSSDVILLSPLGDGTEAEREVLREDYGWERERERQCDTSFWQWWRRPILRLFESDPRFFLKLVVTEKSFATFRDRW